jgi:hypothetical protein
MDFRMENIYFWRIGYQKNMMQILSVKVFLYGILMKTRNQNGNKTLVGRFKMDGLVTTIITSLPSFKLMVFMNWN